MTVDADAIQDAEDGYCQETVELLEGLLERALDGQIKSICVALVGEGFVPEVSVIPSEQAMPFQSHAIAVLNAVWASNCVQSTCKGVKQ